MGWDHPALVLAAQSIATRITDGELDLSNLVVVTPGSRAGRILDSLISQIAQSRAILYTPPQYLTPGRIVSALYQLNASETPATHQQLAWIHALRSLPAAQQVKLVGSLPNNSQVLKRYSELFSKTCTQLAGENIRPREVPVIAAQNRESLIGEIDTERWNALELALNHASELLQSSGGSLASQTELAAVRAGSPTLSHGIVLVATSEIPGLARAAFRKHSGPVECLIAAPQSHAARFDEIGCVIPLQWNGALAELSEDELIFADGPASQAEATFSSLATLDPAPTPQDVVISAPDTSVTPHLISISREIGGVRIRDAAAQSIASAPVSVLISLIAEFCQDQTFDAYSRLVRHPHFESRLIQSMRNAHQQRPPPIGPLQWIRALDRYGASQAPSGIDSSWICDSPRDKKILVDLYASALELLSPLLRDDNDTASHWAKAIRDVVRSIYENRRVKTSTAPGRRTLATFQAVSAALDSLNTLPDSLTSGKSIRACEALQLVLDELAGQQLSPEPVSNSIEVLGWLDAAMDPSPIAIVTGLNEGVVPEKISSDPLLPESLATALRISCNTSRFGRDAYLLSLIRHSRKWAGAKVIVIVGRRDSKDDPLWPSRLLLSDDVLVPRIERLLKGPTQLAAVQRGHVPCGVSGFVVRPLQDLSPPTVLSVSHFKKYLTSPYEFYLDRVLGLEDFGSHNEELDAGSFGNLIHGALKVFGDSPAKLLTKAADIAAALNDSLDSHIAVTFGSQVRPEVQIQIAMARRRISRLADIEAARRNEGWTIKYCEWNDGEISYPHNSSNVLVRGRIDRIDFNARSGTWEIIDYKTGNRADAPDKAHFSPRTNTWKDLQLPLYRHLAKPITGEPLPALSYLLLPRDPADTDLKPLTSKIDLAQADIAIQQVITNILSSAFSDVGSSQSTEGARGALLGIGIVSPGGARPLAKGDDSQ